MIYPFFVVLLLVASFLTGCQSATLVHDQLEVYRRIVREGFGETGDVLSLESLVRLMQLTEGHPKYNAAAMQHAMRLLGSEDGTTPVPFARLHELADKLYGDQISDDPFQPQEIHLALTSDVTSMKVMWTTMQALDKPVVQFLTDSSDDSTVDWSTSHSASAVTSTYTVPQKWWPIFTGTIYEVDMTHLTPGQAYRYRVGGFDAVNNTMRYSDEFTFHAAVRANNPSKTTRAFTLADHGTFMLLGFETVWKMQKLMDEQNIHPNFVFVAGDLSYAGLSSAMPKLNIDKEDEFEHIWDLLAIQNQPVAARVPWMVGNGNHERFYNWSAYTNRYKMPQDESLGTVGNFWYTFTNGNIQWVQISSEHSLDADSDQMVFLRKALTAAQANRAVVPWIVVTLHKPLYCSVLGAPSFAAQLEDIMLEFDVDLVITGHMHAYERVHPVYKNAVTALPTKEWMFNIDTKTPSHCDVYRATGAGPVQLMQGHAGGMQAERFQQPSPAWSAFRMADGVIIGNRSRAESSVSQWQSTHKDVLDLSDNTLLSAQSIADLPMIDPADIGHGSFNYSSTYGFGYITAINATHLHYQAIPNVDGLRNHDEFWLIKDHTAKK